MEKVFRIAVGLSVAIVSIVLLAVLLMAISPRLPSAQTGGIAAVAGGVSEKVFSALYLVAILCCLLWWNSRKRSR